jgi:hypothetical protein
LKKKDDKAWSSVIAWSTVQNARKIDEIGNSSLTTGKYNIIT